MGVDYVGFVCQGMILQGIPAVSNDVELGALLGI